MACCVKLSRRERGVKFVHDGAADGIDTASRPVDTARSGEPVMVEAALKALLLLVLGVVATADPRGWRRLRRVGPAPPAWRAAVPALRVVGARRAPLYAP